MMKKKLLSILLALCLLLTGCGQKGDTGEKGEKGDKGDPGVGIVSVAKSGTDGVTDTYKMTFSDGSTTTFTVTNGTDGVAGANGQNGVAGAAGKDGADGKDGVAGQNGVGITGAYLNEKGELVLKLSAGDPINVGVVQGEKGDKGDTGADGADGQSAYALYQAAYGYTGTEQEWLADLAAGKLSAGEMYTVTFDTAGGSAVAAQQVPGGTKATRPADPTREGYRFDGWYVGDEKWSFIGYTVTEDVTLTAKWAEGTEGLEYVISNDGKSYRVSGYNGTEADVVIPATYKGLPITEIAYLKEGFGMKEYVTSVSIPQGVQTINESAFVYCTKMENIVIPSSVQKICWAFYGCDALTTVYYTGNATEWDSINFTDGNDALINATRYYYSETEPALNAAGTDYDGNYWRYVDGEPTAWVYGG